jgi:hypothetical protein
VVGSERRTIWIVDKERGDRKYFVVRADERLSAFVELERDELSRIHSSRFALVSATLCFKALGPASFSPVVPAEVAFRS